MSGGAFPKRETTFGPVATKTYKRKSQEWPFSHFPPPPMTAKSDNSIPLTEGNATFPVTVEATADSTLDISDNLNRIEALPDA